MWQQISQLFADFPAQKQVAKKMIDLGLGISESGNIVCGGVEVKEVSLATACGVDRRVVSATVHSILSDRLASRLFRGIRPAGALLKDVAHELGFGVVELEANAKKPAIIAHATSLLAKRRISIRQIYAKDPELYENPTLVIITERPIPGALLSKFSDIPAVKKVSIY
jgi:predicted regulator of amino acid metabolism with ACT domain